MSLNVDKNRLYCVKEVAGMMNLSSDTIRRMVYKDQKADDVFIRCERKPGKRIFRTILIAGSWIERQLRKMALCNCEF